jgi:ATP-dependent RNA helicase DeaD
MKTNGIKLKPEFERALLDLGFDEFTEIQEKSIPMIQNGEDLIGLSFTGSGKTAAFGFPTLEKVVPGEGIQLLVILPTRELCNQVTREFKKFTKYKKMQIVDVYGGVSIMPQIRNLERADVVLGTPGRLLDHLSRGTMDLSKVKMLVLDEADKMFEMGFIDDIKRIISRIPEDSQKLLFSATMPTAIMDIVDAYMNHPKKVRMQSHVDEGKLAQFYYDVSRREKFSLLVHILKEHADGLTIVFCGTRHLVDSVNRNLLNQSIKSKALHGGITQHVRKQVMDAFHRKELSVLVATDVAARGLDIKDVTLIINYSLPKTALEYVHRIGRTARAGEQGKVISLVSDDDYENFARILEDRSLSVERLETPKVKQLSFSRPQQRGRPFQQGNRGFNRNRGNRQRR